MKIKVLSRYTHCVDRNECYSFLNLASIGNLLESDGRYQNQKFMVDGIALCLILSIMTGKRIRRYSFDFSSIANEVFSKAEIEGSRVFLMGGTEDEIKKFSEIITEKYKDLVLVGCSSGYVKKVQMDSIGSCICSEKVDLVVVSMGAGMQEEFLLSLRSKNFTGIAYTSGGFVRQTAAAEQLEYYPKLIKLIGLRACYRMFKEPHTVRRYFFDYPRNIFKVGCLFAAGKLKLEIFYD